MGDLLTNGNGLSLKQVTALASLAALLAGVVGSYYIMGYRVDAAEKTAETALHATLEIPVIKRDIEYIRREMEKSSTLLEKDVILQEKTLEVLKQLHSRVGPHEP